MRCETCRYWVKDIPSDLIGECYRYPQPYPETGDQAEESAGRVLRILERARHEM